jgi:3-oxoacyl-[acyl-carrier protein] reductase
MSDPKFNGKIVLITGASRGIGRALSIGFAQRGAQVIGLARTVVGLEETRDSANAAGGQFYPFPVDLLDEAQVAETFAAITTQFTKIDVAFINAGGTVGPRAPIADSDYQQWQSTLDLNIKSAFLTARAAIPLLRRGTHPKIISMGSGMGRTPQNGSSAYSCGKAALAIFTQALAMELLEEGITVNELIPGPVATGEFPTQNSPGTLIKDGSFRGEYFKPAEEVLPLALFLASQTSTGPSGQCFGLNRRLL